jgi:hypothetical protein
MSCRVTAEAVPKDKQRNTKSKNGHRAIYLTVPNVFKCLTADTCPAPTAETDRANSVVIDNGIKLDREFLKMHNAFRFRMEIIGWWFHEIPARNGITETAKGFSGFQGQANQILATEMRVNTGRVIASRTIVMIGITENSRPRIAFLHRMTGLDGNSSLSTIGF